MLIPVLLLLTAQAPGVQRSDSAFESSSRVAFPLAITPPQAPGPQVLAGTGIRTKTFLKVKVYAFGLYVDQAQAAQALAPWKGKAQNELQRDTALYGALLKGQFPMTMRLVMTRDVNGQDMADAFGGALGPRVARAAAERGMTGGDQALAQFRTFFNIGELTKGTELLFTWLPDGRLVSSIGGRVVGEVRSPALAWALFDVYLGRDPISADGKKTVVGRLSEVL